MRTRMTERFGIQYPVMLGGMYQLGRAALAAAVSEAGGLGTITSKTFETPERLREEIRKVKARTDKPFAVNLNLFPSTTPTPNEAFIEVLVEEGVHIVETSGRSPEAILPLLKKAGMLVIHKVPSLKHAKTAERLGVDAVTIVGQETGGHPGMEDVGTLVLLARAVESLKIPIIAGGGFATGGGLLAALAMGADGVVMGTRFMATQEAALHPRVYQWMVEADERATVVIQRSIGSPARVAKNTISEKVLALEANGAPLSVLLPLIRGERSLKVYVEGDLEGGVFSLGQAVGLIHEIPTVQALMESIIRSCEEHYKKLQKIMESC